MTTREWGARRGRGGARANSGGKRAGAGRPKTDDVGYVEFGVRLGPEQIARARQIAAARDVTVVEIFRLALHGRVQLGPAAEPYRRHTLIVSPDTRDRLRERCGEGDIASTVRGIFSGDIEHL